MRAIMVRALGGVALLLPLTTACATAGTSAEEGMDAPAGISVFTVQNNHSDARDMVVYLEPEARGQRATLGTVGNGQTASFNHNAERGYYLLIAAHNLGEIRSDRFNVTGPSTITWTLNTNRVVVNRR